jgi:hypothetical protein
MCGACEDGITSEDMNKLTYSQLLSLKLYFDYLIWYPEARAIVKRICDFADQKYPEKPPIRYFMAVL